jgi:hypothetical protein
MSRAPRTTEGLVRNGSGDRRSTSVDGLAHPEGPAVGETMPTIQVTCGAMLCEVRYWTEAEWASLHESDRPRERAHAPGRGWFGTVPVVGIN